MRGIFFDGAVENEANMKSGDAKERRTQMRELRTQEAPAVVTAPELAALLRVNRKTIYEAAQRGEIPGAFRVGRSLRFSRSLVLAWLGQDRLASD